jgi:UPF0716 protein FxsA
MPKKSQDMRIPIPFILLTLVFAEIAGFILVGEAIGVLPTLGLVLLGMAAGVVLLRRQGVATLTRLRAELAADRPSARPLAEGAVLAVAALLLILPGFLTDLFGLLLFVPFVRESVFRAFRGRVVVRTAGGSQQRTVGPVVDLDRTDYARGQGGANPESPWRVLDDPEA